MYYDDFEDFYTEDSYNNRIGKGSQLTGFIKEKEVNITTGDTRIKESIRDILSTRIGTRFFKPQYGCKIHDLLFEQNTFIIRDMACDYVKEALEKWEPRITVLDIDAEGTEDEIRVEFTYRVNDLGTEGSFVYTIDRKIPPMA